MTSAASEQLLPRLSYALESAVLAFLPAFEIGAARLASRSAQRLVVRYFTSLREFRFDNARRDDDGHRVEALTLVLLHSRNLRTISGGWKCFKYKEDGGEQQALALAAQLGAAAEGGAVAAEFAGYSFSFDPLAWLISRNRDTLRFGPECLVSISSLQQLARCPLLQRLPGEWADNPCRLSDQEHEDEWEPVRQRGVSVSLLSVPRSSLLVCYWFGATELCRSACADSIDVCTRTHRLSSRPHCWSWCATAPSSLRLRSRTRRTKYRCRERR